MKHPLLTVRGRWRAYALLAILLLISTASHAQRVDLTGMSLSEPNDTIPICKDFVLYIDYAWSDFPTTGLQSIQLKIDLPNSVEFTAASINPAYGSATGPTGPNNTVTFTITSDLSQSAGFGRVGIIMHFKCDSTCSGTIAYFTRPQTHFLPLGSSNWSTWTFNAVSTHAVAFAENRWVMKKDALACQYDDADSNSVLYRVAVINNEANSYSREGCLSLNVSSFTDQIPSGAKFDHIEATPPSPNYPPNWTQWNVPTATPTVATFLNGPSVLSTATRWYYVYFWVKYPHSSFSSGQFVVNTANLSWTQKCIPKGGALVDTGSINMCDYHLSGSASKDFIMTLAMPSNPYYYPSNSPGCCGAYKVTFKNTGTAAISNLVIDDPVPTGEDFGSVNTNIPYTGMTCTIDFLDASNNPIPGYSVSYSAVGTYTAPAAPATVKVRWTYGGTALPVLYSINNGISFCFRTTYRGTSNLVAPGDVITNTATMKQNTTVIATASNSLTISQPAPKIIANKMIAPACASPANTNGLYWSGMKVHYRMAVANVGNVNATNCVITDLLPAGLTIVLTPNSVKYDWFVNPNPAWVTPSNPPCSDMQQVTSLTETGPISVSTAMVSGRQQVTWSWPKLLHDCDGVPSYLVIEFDALIDSFAVAGPYDNNFTIHTAQNGDVLSDNARFVLSATPQANGLKRVGMNANGPFSQYASIPPGGTGYYKLHFKNTGNTPLQSVTMLDILPYGTGISILPTPSNSGIYLSRNNAFAISTSGSGVTIPVTASTNAIAGAFTAKYTTNNNPFRTQVGSGFGVTANPTSPPAAATSQPWPTTWTASPAGAAAFTVSSYGNPQTILPQQYVDAVVQVSVPASAKDTACNRFAFEALPVGYGANGMYLHTESNPACVVAAADCVPAPANMVAWWPMDDSVGTTVPELTGTLAYLAGAPSNTGLKVGNVGTTPGAYVGNSAHFDGDSNNYIRVQNTSGLDFSTNSFSIDAWVRLDSASSNRRTIVSKRQVGSNGYAQGYTLYVDETNHLAIQLGYGTSNTSFTMNNPLSYNTWTFVAAVVNRNATGGTVTLYANGSTQTIALNSAWATRSLSNTAELWIGRIHEAGTYPNDLMKGSIDELEIFNTALDSNAVLSIYHAGPAGKCKTPCPDNGHGTGLCDSISSAPFDHGDVDINYLTFTVINRKTSPICWIETRFSTTPASYTGGSLIVTPPGSYAWTYPYLRIPNSGTFGTGASKVLFNLGVNNTLGWSGTVTIVVHHCDGDSCVYSRTWRPVKPVIHVGFLPDSTLNAATLTHVSIVADPTKFPSGTEFGYITAHVDDTAFAIVGGSGADLEIDTKPGEASGVSHFAHSDQSALFELDPDTIGPRIDRVIVGLFLKQASSDPRKPVVHFTVYDTNGEPLSTDSVRADKTVSAVEHQPNAPATLGMQITEVRPNPATSNVEIAYALGTSEDARLELFDILGHSVAVLADGYQTEGTHRTQYNVAALSDGTYLLRLSTRFGQTTTSLRVVR